MGILDFFVGEAEAAKWPDTFKVLSELLANRGHRYTGPVTRRFLDPRGGERELLRTFNQHPLAQSARLESVRDSHLAHPDSMSLKNMDDRTLFAFFNRENPEAIPDMSRLETPRDLLSGIYPKSEDPRFIIGRTGDDPIKGFKSALGEAAMGEKWHRLKGTLSEPTERGWYKPETVYETVPDWFNEAFRFLPDEKGLRSFRAQWKKPYQNYIDLGRDQAQALMEGSPIPDEQIFDELLRLMNYEKQYLKRYK
jgi:hypothetical protein